MSDPAQMADVPTVASLDFNCDFLDLGASKGGSIYNSVRRWGGRGVGIDINPAKVAAAREAGHEVVLGDATQLDLTDAVRYVVMMDFLEHLPNLETVERVLESAARAATDFLYILHPSFEGEEYLAHLGFRQYWWYWGGHKSHIHIDDYCQMFDRLGLHQYMIRYLQPVEDSSHPSVLSADEPKNQPKFDPLKHRPKPTIPFERPIWRAQEIFVPLRQFDRDEWLGITPPRGR